MRNKLTILSLLFFAFFVVNVFAQTDNCDGFLETFDGAPNSPNSFYGNPNWAIYITERDNQYSLPPSTADHGPNCEPPIHLNPSDTYDTTHVVTNFEDAVYVCRNHMMSNILAPGFGIINMTPNHLVDFSEGEAVISVDVSTWDQAGLGRDWWTITLQNPDDFDPLAGVEYSTARNTLWIETGYSNGKRDFGVSMTDGNFNKTRLPRVSYTGLEDLITPSKTARTTFELRVRKNYVKFGMKLPDNQGYHWWVDTGVDASGNALNITWDKAMVMMGHYSYNPRKNGEGIENTWHWDNFSMLPTIPITVIGTDARYADSNRPILNLDAPAPANAQLVLISPDIERIGASLTVSFNGGATWNNLTRVINSDYDPADTWGSAYHVFKTAIPAGTTQLRFTGVSNHWKNWMAKDVYVISTTPTDCTGGCPPLGTPCDDDNPATYNDMEEGNCNCIGTPCPPNGTACDDGNPNTINDVEDGLCNCVGTVIQTNDCELLTNASFDNNTNGWGSWGCTPTSVNGTANLTNIAAGANTWNAGFKQTGVTLEQGKSYTITFRARADANNRLVVVKAGLADNPWTPYLREDLNLTTSMKTYNYNFTMNNATDNNAGFEFMFGTNPANIYIEYASIEESDCGDCPPVGTACDDGNPNTQNDMEDGNCNCIGTPVSGNCNMISNGTFDTDLEPWNPWGSSANLNSGWAYISGLLQSGGNPWDAGFSHPNLLFEQGKSYTITFDAFGGNRDITVKAGLGVAPYTQFHYETVSVNWSSQTFNMTFTMTEPSTNIGSLDFFFGGIIGDVALDNISVREAGCNNKEVIPEPSHLIYPNPFSDKTNIEFDVLEDSEVSIFVSDVTGKKVAILADNEPISTGTYQSVFDGRGLSSGVYYCTVVTGKYRSIYKMVLTK